MELYGGLFNGSPGLAVNGANLATFQPVAELPSRPDHPVSPSRRGDQHRLRVRLLRKPTGGSPEEGRLSVPLQLQMLRLRQQLAHLQRTGEAGYRDAYNYEVLDNNYSCAKNS